MPREVNPPMSCCGIQGHLTIAIAGGIFLVHLGHCFPPCNGGIHRHVTAAIVGGTFRAPGRTRTNPLPHCLGTKTLTCHCLTYNSFFHKSRRPQQLLQRRPLPWLLRLRCAVVPGTCVLTQTIPLGFITDNIDMSCLLL